MFKTGIVVALLRFLAPVIDPAVAAWRRAWAKTVTPLAVGEEAPLPGPISLSQPDVWYAGLPSGLAGPGDTVAWPSRSRLTLLEDGRPLKGPSHAQFQEVAAAPGAYVHWHDGVYFSSSDGSSPRQNGRAYTIRLDPARPRIAGFGSCHTGLLMRSAARRGRSDYLNHNALTYNTVDTLQLVRQLRGDLILPERLDAFLASAPNLAELDVVDEFEAVLLEISNRNLIRYDGWSLNRVAVSERIIQPCGKISPGLLSLAIRWFDHGINGRQEDVRAAAATLLLEQLPGATPEQALVRDIVDRARGEEQSIAEVEDGIRELLALLRVPTVLMLHTLRYMPDGRPLRWPAGFHRQLREIADRLGLPVLDPAAHVEARGADETLADDLEHYRDSFLDELADEAIAKMGLRPTDARPSDRQTFLAKTET